MSWFKKEKVNPPETLEQTLKELEKGTDLSTNAVTLLLLKEVLDLKKKIDKLSQ